MGIFHLPASGQASHRPPEERHCGPEDGAGAGTGAFNTEAALPSWAKADSTAASAFAAAKKVQIKNVKLFFIL
ncbi:MAG: hypothetical protein COT18_10890 [Elusimicrobia bacterium CG08_land_8_20_14_0_20_59_10]|nr:MAG: hypothetical protein COT18_10890 [Elusimicrobia bacterium CG08_land_8_20_14_0_20_59_10]